MDEAEEQVQVSARIPAQMLEELEGRAKAADRSLSAELRRAIRAYLEETVVND